MAVFTLYVLAFWRPALHTPNQASEANYLFLDVQSGLNRIAYQFPQNRTPEPRAPLDTDPEDRFVPQAHSDEAAYKPNPNWMKSPVMPGDNTRVKRPLLVPIGSPAPKKESESSLDFNSLMTKLSTGVAELAPLTRKIPGLGVLTSALRMATIVVPNIAKALADGDETAVARHCGDLTGQLKQAAESLAQAGKLAMTPELAKVGIKAAPLIGLAVGIVDIGVDLFRSHQAPAGSEEERCWESKTMLDSFAAGASALEAFTGPLAPVSAGIALAFALASMMVGQYANGLKEARTGPKR